MDDVEGEDVLAGFVDEVVLLELLGDEVLVVDVEGVELGSHQLGLLVEGDGLGHVFAGEDVGLADGRPAHHHLVVVVVLFTQLLEIQVPVAQVHDVVEPLLAHRREVLRGLQLGLVDDEVQQNFVLVLAHELGLVDGVD